MPDQFLLNPRGYSSRAGAQILCTHIALLLLLFCGRSQDLPVLLAGELIPQVPEEVLIQDQDGDALSTSSPSSPTSSCSEYSPT